MALAGVLLRRGSWVVREPGEMVRARFHSENREALEQGVTPEREKETFLDTRKLSAGHFYKQQL